MKKIIFFCLVFIVTMQINAQELNCTVQVTSQQVEGTEKKVYETLQKSLIQFFNELKWSNFTYKQEEKIECSILINISDRVSSDEFKGTLTLSLRRPIYKSSYYSTMFNYIDKDFTFKYIEFQPLEFAENSYISNLVSLMAYYAYVFIGLDADSYSMNGGTPFFEKAQTIVNYTQSAPDKGWKAFENPRNRYWLIENLLNSSYNDMRKCYYQYHRLGLDMMYDNIDICRNNITEALELLRKVNREKNNLFVVKSFLDAKSDEIINIYSKAPFNEKTNVVAILKEIDPANTSKYQKILTDK